MAKTTLSAKRNLQRWRSHEAGEELETGRREPIYLALVCKNQNDWTGNGVTPLLQGEKESLHIALRCQHQNNTAQATVSPLYYKEKERTSFYLYAVSTRATLHRRRCHPCTTRRKREPLFRFTLSAPEQHCTDNDVTPLLQKERESLHLALRCQHQSNTAQATVLLLY